MAESDSHPDTIGIRDRVSGKAIGLSMVKSVSAIFSHTASRVPWHSHDQIELLFVMNGATVYEFRERESIELAGGHFMVVPPGVQHRGEQDLRMPTTLIGIVLMFDTRGATRNTPFTAGQLGWLQSHFEANSLTVHPLGQDLRRTIARLDESLSGKKQDTDELSVAEMRLHVCAAISGASRQLTAVDARDSKVIVDTAIDYMRANLSETLSIDQLVKHIGYGRSRFFDLFRANTGMTPNDYMRRLRLEVARRLLVKTSRPVTEIAFEVGFNSSQYFSTVFLQYTGLTPSSFRRREAK
jgi:AraC-like DNA-binding protein